MIPAAVVRWAAAPDPAVAQLLHRNGREEARAERVDQAIAIIRAGG